MSSDCDCDALTQYVTVKFLKVLLNLNSEVRIFGFLGFLGGIKWEHWPERVKRVFERKCELSM